MKQQISVSPVTTLLLKASQRREQQQVEQRIHEQALDDKRQAIVTAWETQKRSLLSEIAIANGLVKHNGFDGAFRYSDLVIRDAEFVAQFDLVIGGSVARFNICAHSGQVIGEHWQDGVYTFRCHRFSQASSRPNHTAFLTA